MRAILVNPIYAGDMVWNRRTDARFHKISNGHAIERKQPHGARLEPNGKTDWMIVPDAHPALIMRRTFEQAQRIREGKPACEKQLGRERVVGGWNGARSRFILSGLICCAHCGHRYQGVTRTKPRPRSDGTYCKNYYYACGAYISRGNSVCQYRPVPKDTLERAVVDAVLAFYQRYNGAAGGKLLIETVQQQAGTEIRDLASARQRLEIDRQKVEASIANLLDNISSRTRDLAEARLAELRRQREELQIRADEFERLAAQQHEVQVILHDIRKFLNSLDFTLRHGLPEERKAALRQCLLAIRVHHEKGSHISLNALPTRPGEPVELTLTLARTD